MKSSPLGHPLVRTYLDELDDALSALPPQQARELREQINAHLDDALIAAAGDREVARVLERLGRPTDIVAEAVVPAGVADPAQQAEPREGAPPGVVQPRRRVHTPRLAWPVSALIAVLVIGAGYLIAVESAPALQGPGASIWWYPQDRARSGYAVEITGETVSSTAIRPGQRQGFVVTVTNNSDWTQTVIGPAADYVSPGGIIDVQTGVGGSNPDVAFPPATYTSPGSIPPHQTRALRVTWLTTICQDQGANMLSDSLDLRVRVGWVTRTEVVPLNGYWTLNGASLRANARGECI